MHQSPPSYQNLASLQARSIYRLHLVARVKFSDVTFLIYSDLALNTMSYADLCQPLHGLPDFIDNREIINGSFISWVDNDLEFGPNCKDMSSSAKALSSSCNIKDVNPFATHTYTYISSQLHPCFSLFQKVSPFASVSCFSSPCCFHPQLR